MISKLAFAGAALTALVGCDSLDNPDHKVVNVGVAADGTTVLFFYDGVGVVDPMLKDGRFLPYPDKPAGDLRLQALSRDGARAAVGWDWYAESGPDGGIVVKDRARVDVFATDDGRLLQAFEVPNGRLALSDDGAHLVVQTTESLDPSSASELAVFTVPGGSPSWRLPGTFLFAMDPGANAVAALWSSTLWPDALTQPPTLSLFDLDTGATRLEFPLTAVPLSQMRGQIEIEGFVVSPDGTVGAVSVAKGTDDLAIYDAHILLINLADGTLVRELVLPDTAPETVVVSSGGRYVAAVLGLGPTAVREFPPGTQWELAIWDGDAIMSRKPIALAKVDAGDCLALSPDGALLVAAEQSGVAVYSVPTGEEVERRSYKQNLF